MIEYTVQGRKNTLTPGQGVLKYYPVRAAGRVVHLDEMCEAIAAKTTLTRADVHGTLCAIEEQIAKHVKAGHIVKFGLLGSFRPSVSSVSVQASDEEAVKAMKKTPSAYVKRVRLRFTPSSDLLGKVNLEARFKKVDSVPPKH